MNQMSEGAIAILERLVSYDTVSDRSNLELIDYIRSYLADHGVSSEIILNPDGDKANLFATIGDASLPGYLLSGHTDVVPVAGQNWSYPPFNVTRDGDRLYGRGTADMKGFIACVLAMVPQFVMSQPRIPIHLAFSYDEEVGCQGVHSLITHIKATVAPPLAAFIGEPSEMDVVDSHKGSRGMLSIISGLPCHSSRPDLGASAISAGVKMIAKIDALAEELAANPHPSLRFELPYTTTGVGMVNGGTARNLIPGRCEIVWEIRGVNRAESDDVRQKIDSFGREHLQAEMQVRFPQANVETLMAYDVPPLEAVPRNEAVTLAARFAQSNKTSSIDYGTEAGFFQAAGIPSVVCGPGRDSEAHIAHEWISVTQISRCLAFLEVLKKSAASGA